MQPDTIKPADIEQLSYVQFISLLRETNRCPGGKRTIRKILQHSFLHPDSRVLDIGCNTGFTSLEIARTAGCHVTGIDIIPEAIQAARQTLETDVPEIQRLVSFEQGSALNLSFPANHFDLVVCGGATSFIDNKQAAINEYHRVLKPWGFLSVTNLCYIEPPPGAVVDAVSRTIGVQINPWTADEWLAVFQQQQLFETYLIEKYRLFPCEEAEIDRYVQYFMNKEHLLALEPAVRHAIETRWKKTIAVFNENHRYLGFILVLLRKDHIREEPELFWRVEQVEDKSNGYSKKHA